MHIAEGVLTPVILGSGAIVAAAGTMLGLRRLDERRLILVAMLTAAFFVASLVHVPIGPGNAHLVLNGLLGAILGWAAFPAILTALTLQAVLFQFGGLTVLGVNTVVMALPAVVCGLVCRPLFLKASGTRTAAAFACGSLSVAGSALLAALALIFSEEGFLRAAQILLLVHLPIMAVEGLITAAIVNFLIRVAPETFHA